MSFETEHIIIKNCASSTLLLIVLFLWQCDLQKVETTVNWRLLQIVLPLLV